MPYSHPQIHHSASLCDALDRVIETGVVALGELTISVADIDLLHLGLQLVITSIEKGRDPSFSTKSGGGNRILRGGPQADRSIPSTSPVTQDLEPSEITPAIAPDYSSADNAGNALRRAMPCGPEDNKNGLAQLVLTLIRLLHELLKRQAIRRMQAGTLSIPQMESLGITLMRQGREIEKLAKELGLDLGDLNLDLGPLGRLL